MFRDCSLLKSINFFNFDTSQATDMNNMFANCLLLTTLNLSNFNTIKVKNMHFCFVAANH